MSKNESASAKFSIDWVATSLFVLVCTGLLTFLAYSGNVSLYLKVVLDTAWNLQLVSWRSAISSFSPELLGGPSILIAIILIEHFRPWRKLQKRFRKEFWLDVVYNMFSFGLWGLIGGNLAYALIVGPFNYFVANVFNADYPLLYVIDEVPM